MPPKLPAGDFSRLTMSQSVKYQGLLSGKQVDSLAANWQVSQQDTDGQAD